MPSITNPFSNPTPLESLLIQRLEAVDAANQRELAVTAPFGQNQVRGSFLRWLLLEAIPAQKLPIARFILIGGEVKGELSLNAAKLAVLPRFESCTFDELIDMNDADIVGFEVVAGSIKKLHGDRLKTHGSLILRSPTKDDIDGRKKLNEAPELEEGALMEVKHRVRLCGATIRGNLDFRGCTFLATTDGGRKPEALLADGMSIDGNLLMRDSFTSFGAIILNGSRVGRNIDLSGADLRNPDGYTLSVAGGKIGGSVYLGWPRRRDFSAAPQFFSSEGTIRLEGAEIVGDLDCSGGRFKAPAFALGRTATPDQASRANYLLAIDATGIAVGADVKFVGIDGGEQVSGGSDTEYRQNFSVEGGVNIDSAKIGGQLSCGHARFTASNRAPPTDSVAMTGERRRPLPDSASLEEIANSERALSADEAKIGGDAVFGDYLKVAGKVNLIGASIGGDLRCEGPETEFRNAGTWAIEADGVSVAGTTFVNDFVTDGLLSFVVANFSQGFYVTDLEFDCDGLNWNSIEKDSTILNDLEGPSCGIFARYTQVKGAFRWHGIQKKEPNPPAKPARNAWLYLFGSRADEIEDEVESWNALHRFNVTACEYRRITGYRPSDAGTGVTKPTYHRTTFLEDMDWRLGVLDNEYAKLNAGADRLGAGQPARMLRQAPRLFALAWRSFRRAQPFWRSPKDDPLKDAMGRFAPQPYVQLAAAARDLGYEHAANRILVRLERNKTRYGDLEWWRQLGRWVLDIGLEYGFSPFRPVLAIIAWSLVSSIFFYIASEQRVFVPTYENQERICASGDDCEPPRVAFNALLYAFDTLVPFVDLDQRKNWVIGPVEEGTSSSATRPRTCFCTLSWSARSWAYFLFVFNTFFGWLLTSFLAAGITRLIRGAKE